MVKNSTKVHSSIRRALGCQPSDSDADILGFWHKRTRERCKPCWELKYCPYGPMVEEFPLLPSIRKDAKQHNDYIKSCLASGKLSDGRPLDPLRRKYFEQEVKRLRLSDHPEEIPAVLSEAQCRVFGHLCPVFFVAESFTETKDIRSKSRLIPREVMLKVVRRDGQICQRCFEPVADNEVEFDHVIPFSRGGPTRAENLKLTHRDCNRKKQASVDEILAPDPRIHYTAMIKRMPPKELVQLQKKQEAFAKEMMTSALSRKR